MEKLVESYNRALHLLIGIAIVYVLISKDLHLVGALFGYAQASGAEAAAAGKNLLGAETTKTILPYLLEHTLPIFGVGIGLFLYRRWLWKIFYPEYNFSGTWIGVSIYEASVAIEQNESGFSPPHAPVLTVIEFDQDVFSARLKNGRSLGEGVAPVEWWSTSLEIEGGTPTNINLSYRVEEAGRPAAFAVETITILEKEIARFRLSLWRCPHYMRGKFHHAFDASAKTLTSGHTHYVRIGHDALKHLETALEDPKTKPEEIDRILKLVPALRSDAQLRRRFLSLAKPEGGH